jgi:hypothetical protein
MSFGWLTWSNPVAVWWGLLLAVSAANVALWLLLHRGWRRRSFEFRGGVFRLELLVLLSAAYVFGCAFRSVLPRADVQRICLFDTWLSSVLVGRSVATIAEVCFVIQWAIVLRLLGSMAKSDAARNIAFAVVPVIVLAECCSWYAVITTDYLGNTIENSLWALAFLLIAAALLRLMNDFRGVARIALATTAAGIAGYLTFLASIDVPMYFARWQADLAGGKQLLGLFSGLHDLSTRWIVTRDFMHWKDEIAWMSLYFSVAVWSSLALCGIALVRDRLLQFCTASPRPRQRLQIEQRPMRAALRGRAAHPRD